MIDLEAEVFDDVPVCVDLDGTLIRSDLLFESVLHLIRHHPLQAPRILGWLMLGKARLKRELAKRAKLNIELLPYDETFLTWLRESCGHRRRVLCTAADSELAIAVANHVGVFDEVLASDGMTNLSGLNKAKLLCARYGEGGFDYAGNASSDMHVWRCSRRAIVVNASPGLRDAVAQQCHIERDFSPKKPFSTVMWARVLRPQQWLKNILVFLPLLAAHLFFDGPFLMQSILAFFAFGLCASSGYVLNDLLDIDADRHHPRKKIRPFAAGHLALQQGLLAAPLIALAAFLLGYLVSPGLVLVLVGYYVMTTAYSLWLKRMVMLDVIALSGLYTMRIFAGGAATSIPLSSWLLAFSMFLFLGLAMLKRYTELRDVLKLGGKQVNGRGYEVEDLPVIRSFGGTSSYMAVVVLALYINSASSDMLYRHSEVLWLLCPLLLYWQSRMWIIAHRNCMHDDPMMFAVRDRTSWCVVFLACAIMFGAL